MHRSFFPYLLAFLLVRGLLCNPNGAYANENLLIVFEDRINDRRTLDERSSLDNKGFLLAIDGRCRKYFLKSIIYEREQAPYQMEKKSQLYLYWTIRKRIISYTNRVLTERLL